MNSTDKQQCRLTYNYWRKGGYTIGSEDYRWEIVKNYTGPAVFFAFNVVFISLLQSHLLFWATMPYYVLLLTARLASVSSKMPTWGAADTIGAATMLTFIAISWIADQQQWNYYEAREQYRKTAKVPHGHEQANLERGFNTSRLFRYSRHPNFAGEQGVWVTLYLWSCAVTGTWYHWAGFGAFAYLALFQASTWLTELLSTQKYPEYKDYQKMAGKFLPSFNTKPHVFSGHRSSNSTNGVSKRPDATNPKNR